MSMVIDLKDYVPAPEAAEMLGIKYPAFWARISRGHVKTIKVGRFHLVKKTDLINLKAITNDNTENLGEATG